MLIPCPACHRQVSVQAVHCPGCGHPIAGEQPVEVPAAVTDASTDVSSPSLEEAPSSVTKAESRCEVEPTTEAKAGAGGPDEGSTLGLPGLSPDPDPSTPVRLYQPPRACDIPGSIPAAILLLVVFALGLIARAVSAGSGAQPSGAVSCVTLILALGLLRGGEGFRAWGVFSHAAGLLVWPLLLLGGMFGPAGPGDYLGLVFNIGILMLLAGEPSRKRVRAGVTIAVLGIVVSGAVSALFPPSEPPVASGQFVPAGTYLPVTEPYHDPQEITLPEKLGSLSLTVPSGLPKLESDPSASTPHSESREASSYFSGIQEHREAGVAGFRLKTGYFYKLHEGADLLADGKEVVELSRSDGTLGGKPSVRVNCTMTGEDGVERFARYELVTVGRYYYALYVIDPEQSFVEGETADEFFNSVRFPAK